MIKLTDLTSALPVCHQLAFSSSAHEALRRGREYEGFVAPPLRMLTDSGDGFRHPIVLISAPGAVGKSTLADHISAGRATALWDLSRIQIGDNTFIGTLAETFGAKQLQIVLDGFHKGQTLFVFDAFDEAELLSGWDRVESFVKDIWRYTHESPYIAAVFLARSETAARLDDLLTELSEGAPRHTRLEIDYFDESGARKFITRQLERVHERFQHEQHPQPFEQVLDGLFAEVSSVLGFEERDPWSVKECRSFLGYAPVLQALAKFVAPYRNLHELAMELRRSRSQNRLGILPSILNGLVDREKEKFLNALRQKPRPDDAEEPEWDAIYNRHEQLRRIFLYIVEYDGDAYNPRADIPAWLADWYADALKSLDFWRNSTKDAGEGEALVPSTRSCRMITYRSLSRTPAAFKSLTGLSVAEFDALCREWIHADAVARANAPLTREDPHPRQRAPGAGRKWVLDAPTRLLAALVWLKLYPTWEVLGFLFGVEESATRRSTQDVLARLESMAVFPLERRPRRTPGKSLSKLIEDCPVVEVIIDSHEQRTRRPTGWERQKPFYSGKKKAHTLKTQAAVSLEGRVQAVSESVPGSTSDLALLERSGVVERLGPDEAVGADKAYVGAEARFPGTTFYVPVKKPPGGERTPEETRYNRTLASVRIVVEHFFARLSRFGALAQVWRHRRADHSGVFRVAAWLADRQIAAAAARVQCG